jgi:hypothetical protein
LTGAVNASYLTRMAKPGRNSPCPCGSNVKYKRCCGRSTTKLSGFTSEERDSALTKLRRFLDGPGWARVLDEAEDLFWDEVEDNPFMPSGEQRRIIALMSQGVFEAWLFFDYQIEPDRYVVDAFLETASGITPGERRFLRMMKTSSMRLYEVTDVRPGESLTLRDVFTDELVQVRERSASRGLACWTWLAARVISKGASGSPELDGGALPYSPMQHEQILALVGDRLDDLSSYLPEHDERQHWADLVPLLHASWISPPLPRLVNYDGDPVVQALSRFEIVDADPLIAALDASPSLEREPHGGLGWVWSGKGRDREESVVLGSLQLSGDLLVLRTNSVERDKRGRTLLARIAKDLIHVRGTVIEDSLAAAHRGAFAEEERDEVASAAEHDPRLRDAIHDATEEVLIEHYERWIDEPIPMLDGQTPRAAAAGPAPLRARVIGLIKGLEQMYEDALARGEAAYDPTWIRDELELGEALGAERGAARAAPQPAHSSLVEPMPAIVDAARAIAERMRRERGTDFDATISRADLERDLVARAFLRDHADSLSADNWDERHAWLEVLGNFELHLRKAFWVDPPLAWMLGATEIDLRGGELRVPFASFAVVFTDRYALGLAERMLSREPRARLRGRILRSVTAYVTQTTSDDDLRRLRVAFSADADDGQLPSLLIRELVVRPDASLDAILDSHVPGAANELEPAFVGSPIRRVVQLVFNAILYTNSVRPSSGSWEPDRSGPGPQAQFVPSDEVYFLPGTIDIGSLRKLVQMRRSSAKRRSIMQRSMVRGHWRRAPSGWKDQRPRWIAPHWRGPSEAAIVEKNYRLEP